VYFINCGGAATTDYNYLKSLMGSSLLNKDVIDQKYDVTTSSAIQWGYGEGTNSGGDAAGDISLH